jgi:hypothetical protein
MDIIYEVNNDGEIRFFTKHDLLIDRKLFVIVKDFEVGDSHTESNDGFVMCITRVK